MISSRYRNDGRSILRLSADQLSSRDAVQRKVDSGAYPLESVPCNLCGRSDFLQLSEKDRYGLSYSVVICKSCGLAQTNPRMNQDAYNAFYDNEYRPIYVGSNAKLERFFEAEVAKGRKILADLESLSDSRGRDALVLEVGCGAGGILQPFRAAGYRTLGCDLGEEYLKYGRDVHGLDLVHGSLADLELTEEPYLVIYSHVLEHILDPMKELTLVREIVSSGGFVYVEVPGLKWIRANYDSDFLRYLQNAHTYHFTFGTLSNLMRQSGFSVVTGDEQIRMWAKPGETVPYTGPSDFDDAVAFLKSSERVRPLYRFHPRVLVRNAKMILLRTLDALGLRDPLRAAIRKLRGRG